MEGKLIQKVFLEVLLSELRLDPYLGLGCFSATVNPAAVADASSKEGEKQDCQKH